VSRVRICSCKMCQCSVSETTQQTPGCLMDSGQGQLACMSGRDELFGAGHCEPSPNAVLLLLPPPPTLAEMRRPVYKQHSTFWRRLGGRAVATWCELCGLHTRLVQRCAQLEHGCGATMCAARAWLWCNDVRSESMVVVQQ